MDKAAICATVNRRAESFDAAAVEWCRHYFDPIVLRCSIAALSWESVIDQITTFDPQSGRGLDEFYQRCLRHNPLRTVRSLDPLTGSKGGDLPYPSFE